LTEDGFEWVEGYLDDWVMDMRDPELKLGAPSKSPGFIAGGMGYTDVSDTWGAQAKARSVDVINATLADMSPVERSAVMHVRLYAVFRFREPVEDIYLRARMKIGVRLRAADFS